MLKITKNRHETMRQDELRTVNPTKTPKLHENAQKCSKSENAALKIKIYILLRTSLRLAGNQYPLYRAYAQKTSFLGVFHMTILSLKMSL